MVSLSKQEKLSLVSELGTLLASGIAVADTVDSLLKEAKGNRLKILTALKKDLEEGKTIADSFAKFSDAFDPISVSLIRSAEEAGTLDATLKDIVLSLRREIDFDDKVRAALAYPGMILLVFAAVLTMIIVYVVPKISTVFTRLKINLPLPTKILIAISNFVLSYAPFVAALVVVLIILTVLLYKYRKRDLTNFVFSFPYLSSLARNIDLAHFCHNTSLLLSAGIPINESLDLVKGVVSKKEVYKMVTYCKKAVDSGDTMSSGLKDFPKIVPQTMIRITEAGEKSGKIEDSMAELSEYFERRVENSLKTITTMIEPIMLVVIGLLVGGMMLAIIAPIYNMIGQIRTR